MTAISERQAFAATRKTTRRVVGDAMSKVLHLPPATTEFTVHRDLRVPMRDGVALIADHYEPLTPTPAGTLLVRGPYGRGFPENALFAAVYARRGYHVVVQSVRGTFGSEGVFNPMVQERADGADTVAWLRDQSWFTGTFATIGMSYLGFTQWALLADPPPELMAAVIIVGPHDFRTAVWGAGSFALNDFLGWSYSVSHQEDTGKLRGMLRQVRSLKRIGRAAAEFPLGEAGRTLLGAGAPWYESWLQPPDGNAEFWDLRRFADALDHAQIPVLLISGWQDIFLEQTLEQYRQLHARDVDVALTMGPWTHMQTTLNGAGKVTREALEWFDAHLAGGPPVDRAPVHLYVGNSGWIDLPAWPPATTNQDLFLESAGRLTTAPLDGPTSSSTFLFDPADPTPTVGGRLLSPNGGYRDDARLARRPDAVTFTTEVLTSDLFVFGAPVVELAHDSDNRFVDVFVRIDEIDAKGKSRNVSDGYLRLDPDRGAEPVRIRLDEIGHRFRAGSQLRLVVAGGSHPRFARNMGTGEPPLTGRAIATATHVLRHNGLSRLTLPARGDLPSAD